MAFLGLGSRSTTPNRLGSIQVGTSEYGVCKPIGWGSFKAPIKLLDYTDFKSIPQTGGGKGGQVSSYEYYAAVDAMVVQGPIGGFGDVYDGGGASSLLASTENFTIPSGGGTYQVDFGGVSFYYDEGVTYPVTYSVTANDFGSDGSITLSGSQPATFEKLAAGGGSLPSPGALQYTVNNTGLYTFSGADAGTVVSITYAYTTADVTDTTSDGTGHTDGFDARSPILRYALTSALGTTPQAPWGYMLSAHPERALRYDGLARILCTSMDLGSDASTPSLSLEVLNGRLKAFGSGIADCDPSVIITDALTDETIGCAWNFLGDLTNYSNFCVANNLFMSPFVDSVSKMTEILQEICDLSNSAPVWSGAVLKIRPYGDTTAVGNGRTYSPDTEPIYEIDDDECICGQGEEPVKLSWPDLADNYNRVQFEYTARNDNYNTALIHEQDSASILANGLLPMQTVTAHQYCVQFYAAMAMNMLLRRKSVPLRTYEFTLPWYYQLLEPMDIIQMNLTVGGLGLTPMRVVSVDEQDDYSLKVTAEDFLFGTASGVVFPKGGSSSNSPSAHDQPGNTLLQMAYLPSSRVTGGDLELWLALGGGTSWGGCDVLLSLDGNTYKTIGRQFGASRAGSLTAALATGSDPDTSNTASVTLTGSLATVSMSDADALATLCLVGSELVSYETASLTGSTATTNSYDLTYLRRGVFSSGIQAHSSGEQFVRLDDSLFKYVIDPSLAGKTVFLKFTSFNLVGQEEQLVSWVSPYTIQLSGGGSATTMTVASSLNTGGTTATVSVSLGGSLTATGTATLQNGAVLTLPYFAWSSEALSTWYGVNYNPATSAYVLYTDQNAWLADQATMVDVGSTTTPASGSGGSYLPSTWSDLGSYPTSTPTDAWSGSGSAVLRSMAQTVPYAYQSDVLSLQGFSGVTSATKTLSATVAMTAFSSGTSSNTGTVDFAYGGGGFTPVFISNVSAASATYTASIPSGTDLSTLVIRCNMISSPGSSGASSSTMNVSNVGIA